MATSEDFCRPHARTSNWPLTEPIEIVDRLDPHIIDDPDPSAPLSNRASDQGRQLDFVVISTTPVDLMGRLSNPPKHLKHLVDESAHEAEAGSERRPQEPRPATTVATTMVSEEAGRLSNPAPRPVHNAASTHATSTRSPLIIKPGSRCGASPKPSAYTGTPLPPTSNNSASRHVKPDTK